MPKNLLNIGMFVFLSVCTLGIAYQTFFTSAITVSGAPPDGIDESEVPVIDSNDWMKNWKRPDQPPTVGLQVGHWKNSELPEELSELIGNTGATGGGKTEVEINLLIAQLIKDILEPRGVVVDIIPATVPPDYWADAFVSIHADGSTSSAPSGFKIAGPWRDLTGKSTQLVSLLQTEYSAATNLAIDPNITRNMRGYYAFAWWKYEHSIHPMTTAVIVETGFLTSPIDRKIIVNKPHIAAEALAKGIVFFLQSQGLDV
jgi:N-acetylmuramoyl-L-alanine amidase